MTEKSATPERRARCIVPLLAQKWPRKQKRTENAGGLTGNGPQAAKQVRISGRKPGLACNFSKRQCVDAGEGRLAGRAGIDGDNRNTSKVGFELTADS